MRRILARDNDPNADSISLSYVGMPDDVDRAVDCAVIRADLRELDRLVSRKVPSLIDRPHYGHGWIQPISRYEMDAVAADGPDLLIAPVLYGQEDDMPTPKLDYVPQLWRAKPGGTELREQASDSAPVIAKVPAGAIIFTVGEHPSSIGWRLAVAGDPERLFYVKRAQIDDLPPGGRDAELYAGIAAVVAARMAGKPVPTGSGVSTNELKAALEQISALSQRIRLKDEHEANSHATYPNG